jgi:hypothetical protein
MIILILLITILGFVLSEGSLGVRLFKTITGTVMLLSVAALIVTIYISVVEPLFSSNSVDFSKKVFGVPFYFFLFLTMFSAIARGKRK